MDRHRQHEPVDVEANEARKGPSSSSEEKMDTKPPHTSPDPPLQPDFEQPLTEPYLHALSAYANGLTNTDLNNPCVSYYGRLRFYSLQHTSQELNALNQKALIDGNPSWHDLERLRFLLHEHATQMRDLEYINEHLIGISEDAYHNIKDRISDNNLTHESPKFKNWLYSPPHTRNFGNSLQVFLQMHLPTWLSWSNSEKKSQPAYYAKGKLPTKISMTVRVLAGLSVALASASVIIVPIVVMSFGASKDKSLVVTSVAVVLFGFVLAAVVKARSENVFIATATYAAVLVVFVGVSGGNGP